MSKYKLLYKQYEFKSLPLKTKVYISDDNKYLYYHDNNTKVYLKMLCNMPKISKDKININIDTCNEDDITKVGLYVNVDKDDLDVFINKKNSSVKNKVIKALLKQCYDEYCNSYNINLLSSVICKSEHNIDEYILHYDKVKNKKSVAWMLQKETDNISRYYYSKPVLTIKNKLVNIETGEVIDDINTYKEFLTVRGGVIVDSTINWIYDIINLSEIQNDSTKLPTLIICNQATCTIFKVAINEINEKIKCITIDETKLCNTLSKATKNVQFIIVYYKQVYTDLNKKISDIIKSYNIDRIVLDSTLTYSIMLNSSVREQFMNCNVSHIWAQMDKLPLSCTDLMTLIKFVIDAKEINFPLYNNSTDNVEYLCNLIKLNKTKSSHMNNKHKIREIVLKVTMNCTEINMFNFCVSNCYDTENKQFHKLVLDCINELDINWLTYNDYIRKNNNKKEHTELQRLLLDNYECQICNNIYTHDKIVITKCTHILCMNCIFNITKYTSTCPFCRSNIELYEMIRLKRDIMMVGSKVNKLLHHIKNNNLWKCIILCKHNRMCAHIYSMLRCNKIRNIYTIKENINHKGLLYKYNKKQKYILLLSFSNIELLNKITDVNNIIMYDNPYIDGCIKKEDLYKLNIYNKNSETLFYFLTYEGTIESEFFKH